MTAVPRLEADYRRACRPGGGSRLLAGLAIFALHLSALAVALAAPASPPEPEQEPPPMMVRFITEAPRPPAPAPAIPPPPPKPVPRLVASARPIPAAIQTPPPEAEPVEVVAASEPAPAATAPAAEPAAAEPLVPPGFVAAYLNNPGPKYPYLSRQRREEGEVLLKVLVGVEGRAREVRIERSSGSERLDAAAAEVVQARWRFEPARRGSEAVEAWVLVPIIFQLRK